MKNSSSLNVRIPDELRERLEAVARADDRPLGGVVRRVLRDWLDRAAASDQGRAA